MKTNNMDAKGIDKIILRFYESFKKSKNKKLKNIHNFYAINPQTR